MPPTQNTARKTSVTRNLFSTLQAPLSNMPSAPNSSSPRKMSAYLNPHHVAGVTASPRHTSNGRYQNGFTPRTTARRGWDTTILVLLFAFFEVDLNCVLPLSSRTPVRFSASVTLFWYVFLKLPLWSCVVISTYEGGCSSSFAAEVESVDRVFPALRGRLKIDCEP